MFRKWYTNQHMSLVFGSMVLACSGCTESIHGSEGAVHEAQAVGDELANPVSVRSLPQDSDTHSNVPERASAVVVDANARGATWAFEKPLDLSRYETVQISFTSMGTLVATDTFLAGDALQVEQELSDGDYRWRLVLRPTLDAEVKRILGAARAHGDRAEIQRLTKKFQDQGKLATAREAQQNVHAGFFMIRDGEMVQGGIEQ